MPNSPKRYRFDSPMRARFCALVMEHHGYKVLSRIGDTICTAEKDLIIVRLYEGVLTNE